MKLSFAARTDVGQVRSHNEDNFLIDKNIRLFIVADGMGGHASGEIASAMAVNSIREALLRDRDMIEQYHAGSDAVDRRDLIALLEQAVQSACYQIYENAQRNPSQRGMGTTIVLLLIANNRGFIAHVGDSRIYLIRGGQVHQVTEDHSLLNELMKQGRVQSRSDLAPRYKNAVTRAVGIYESVEVDTLDFDILPADRFILATDGLTGYMSNAKLLELAGEASDTPDDVVDRYIDFANGKGGKDNITTVYVYVEEGEPDQDYETIRLKLATLKSLALFRYLNYQELVKVMNVATERHFKPGEIVFREGDVEDCLYIILKGSIQILKQNVEITVLSRGAHFGDMSLVDQSPRSADCVALDDVTSLIITRRAFYDILRKNPTVAVKLLWSFLKVLTGRLRSTSDELRLIKSLYQEKAEEEAADLLPSSWLEPVPEAEKLAPATVPPAAASPAAPGPLRIIREGAEPEEVARSLDGTSLGKTIPQMPVFEILDGVDGEEEEEPPPVPPPSEPQEPGDTIPPAKRPDGRNRQTLPATPLAKRRANTPPPSAPAPAAPPPSPPGQDEPDESEAEASPNPEDLKDTAPDMETPESKRKSTPKSKKKSTPESKKKSTPESKKKSTPESKKKSTPEASEQTEQESEGESPGRETQEDDHIGWNMLVDDGRTTKPPVEDEE